ncbi:MAG: zinc ribbon domain-containing protein [Planctomycetes bacterium]|nr:zinc ribbon domain-containing protein [Planctomycetota bacterium]
MKIYNSVKNKTVQVRNRLTRINDMEPLSLLSILVIFLLDIFILVNLFTGLNNHASQLVKPHEYIPYICRDIIIDENWVKERKISRISSLVLREHRYYYYRERDQKEKHEICKIIIEQIELLKKDKNLIALCRKRDELSKRYNSYDDYQKRISDKAKTILSERDNVERDINRLDSVNEFWEIIERQSLLSEQLKNDLRRFNFLHPIKRLFYELLFLVPILLVVLFWNNRCLKREKWLQAFVSSHLLVVTIIPLFYNICHAAFDIIPKNIIKEFIHFLESIHLIAIWHYALIVVAVIITFFLIYIIQKKVFTKSRMLRQRLLRKQCMSCGRKIEHDGDFCPFCGKETKIVCKHCNKITPKGFDYCIQCGEVMDKTIVQ